MIDLVHEHIIDLYEAARLVPPRRGKRVHPSTVWRWIRRGIRGIHLEHGQLGGRLVTSIEAIDRFSKALSERASARGQQGGDRER